MPHCFCCSHSSELGESQFGLITADWQSDVNLFSAFALNNFQQNLLLPDWIKVLKHKNTPNEPTALPTHSTPSPVD